MNAGKIFLSVLAGAAAGAVAGILFAPDEGAKTRKKILKKGEDYADSLKDKFDELFDAVAEKFEKTKSDVTDYAEKAKQEVSNYAERAKEEDSGYAEKKMSKPEETGKYGK